MNDTDAMAGRTLQARWAQMRPLLGRLGLQAADPGVVAGWLQAATGGTRHEAQRALQAMARHRWALDAAADGAFTLHAGDAAWRLQPVPPARPASWRVEAVSA